MNYPDFKRKYPIGSSVASPEGYYSDQCVSYVRMYMKLVQGFISGPLGNAVDIPTNPIFLKVYQKVSTPQVGDLMFWGDDTGGWTGIYGHTAIYDGNGYMMNQNYNGSGVISRDRIFTSGFIGYYRKKVTMPTEQDVKDYFRAWEGREPTKSELEGYPKKHWRSMVDNLLKSQRNRYEANTTVLKSGKYIVK